MSSPRPSLLLLAALVIVVAVYAPVLSGPFLWDDRHLIVHSALVRDLAPVIDYFRLPFWSGGETGPATSYHYRPLTVLTFALDRRIHLDNPSGFHATNLLLHLINVALVFALARTRGASGLASALAAAGFGLLPRLCEAAAWISGRTDLLATLFVLLSLWIGNRPGRIWPGLAALCLLLGLFSKEVAIAGVIAHGVRAVLDRRTLGAKATLVRLIPLLIVLAVYGCLRIAVSLEAPTLALDSRARLLTVFEAIGRYFVMLVDPWQPRTQIGEPARPAGAIVALGVLVLLGLAFGLVRWRKSLTAETWWLVVLALVPLALVVHVIPISIGVVAADRFLYLPAAALLLLLAPRLDALLAARRALVAAPLVLLVTLGWRTSSRVADFASEARFWFDALRTTPTTNSLPAVELGGVYYRAGLYTKALSLYRRGSQTQNPGAVSAHAVCLGWLGSYDEARSMIERSISAQPGVPKYWLDRALIELHDLNFEAARAAASRALAMYPDYMQARDVVAVAAELEAEAVKLLAGSDSAHRAGRHAEARFLTRAGRYPDALRAWQGLLQGTDLDGNVAGEAWEYLIRFAEPSLLESLRRAAHSPPPHLQGALAARLNAARELEDAFQRSGLGI